MIMGGDDLKKVPASSIFYEEAEYNKQGEQEKEVLVEGQVYKKSNTSDNQILYLKNNSITYQDQTFFESKIIIYDNSFINIPIGKTIRLYTTVQRFQQARNPGNFDQREHYAKQRIYGYGYLDKISDVAGKENFFLEKLYQFRQSWKTALQQQLGEKNGTILSAMLLAEKAELDSDIKELYQKNGISHILAISGLHISFIGMGIYQVLRKRMGVSYGVSGLISVLILGGYVLMIGLSVSVFRAFVMLLLRIGADVSGRVYDVLTAVLLSAGMLAVYQPLLLLDAAFWMSHGAIVGIVAVLPKMKAIAIGPRKKSKIWEGILSSLSINLTLLPILLHFYYEISTYSVFLNVMVIPLMSVILSCGMFGSLLMGKIPFMGEFLLEICGFILSLYEAACAFCNRLPLRCAVFGKPERWQMIVYYGVLIFWLCRKRVDAKQNGLKHFCLLLLASLLFVKIPDGKLHITMLDVGQGDCIYIEGPSGKNYLVDGGSSDVKQIGKYRIEPYLKSQGVGHLDYVFVSHGDIDHCNGIMEMLGRQDMGVKIRNLVLPANYGNDEYLAELAKRALEQGVEVLCMGAGQEIVEGALVIRCIQPAESVVVDEKYRPRQESLSGNAGSMVLSLEFDVFRMLFTGDVEGEGEEQLVKNLEADKENEWDSYDVLKVSHHGSKNSSTEAFLKQVYPKLALISAGGENRYGHPHRETLERLNDVNCRVLETAKCGAVMLTVDGEIKVDSWINGWH